MKALVWPYVVSLYRLNDHIIYKKCNAKFILAASFELRRSALPFFHSHSDATGVF